MSTAARICVGLAAAFVLGTTAACGSPAPEPSAERSYAESALPPQSQKMTTEQTAAGNGGMQVIAMAEPVLLAEGTALLDGGETEAAIRLWMTSGKEITDPEPGPFQGTFLQGQFELAAAAGDNKELARFPLNDAFHGEEMSFRKGKLFELQFDDYNGDGHPDFSIGQWSGQNGNMYALLTIDRRGFRVLETDIYASDHRSSIRFRKAGEQAFVNQYYDQRKGYVDVIHHWTDGAFRRDAPIEAKEIHPAGTEDE